MELYVVESDLVVQHLHIFRPRKGASHWCLYGFPFVLSYPLDCKEQCGYSARPVHMHWMLQNMAERDHDLFGPVMLALVIGHV